MPQPLSKIKPTANIVMSLAGVRILNHNPSLGLLAMECIVSWTNVENFLLNMYVQLMGGDEETVVAAYLAIETQSAKTQMIRTIAEKKLNTQNLKLFRAILAVAKSAQKDRDKLAHWVWGFSRDLPEAFLLKDPRLRVANSKESYKHVFVYIRDDFAKIIALNDRICGFGLQFSFILRDHPENREGGLYDRLCAEPEIREKLDRQT